jgi:hypothetical protein
MELRRTGPRFFAVVTGHETIETIHDITRKNFAATPRSSNAEQRSTNDVETDPSLLHRPSRRDLYSGLTVRPEHDAPRPARSRFDVGAPAGGRLQPQESCRGLRDLRRRRDQYPLIHKSSTPRTSNDPDGMPPSGSLRFWRLCGASRLLATYRFCTCCPHPWPLHARQGIGGGGDGGRFIHVGIELARFTSKSSRTRDAGQKLPE